MELDPTLAGLRAELDRLGFVTAPHRDHLCVRLPLLASVRVRVVGGVLRLEPLFGPFGRARALAIGAVGVPAAVAAAFAVLGAVPLSIAATAGAAAYLISDAYRLVLTEGCMTRLQLLWSALAPAARSDPALAPGATAPQLRGRLPNDAPALAGRPTSG